LVVGDCVEQMGLLDAESVDAVVCDPPYGLEFMGKEWDSPAKMLGQDNAPPGGGINYFKRKGDEGYVAGNAAWYGRQDPHLAQQWHQAWAEQALRVLKPGGHLVAFGGSRTYHRMACAVEDAGFEIRDQLMYLYGSGFPKSHNLSGEHEGIGTALKPAHEPIVLARKPLIGTVAANVQTHGVGGLNIDACRIDGKPRTTHKDGNWTGNSSGTAIFPMPNVAADTPDGRWPANVLLDAEAAQLLDAQTGDRPSAGEYRNPEKRDFRTTEAEREQWIKFGNPGLVGNKYANETGGASRFFYTAKASSSERNAGLDDERNTHPTVKPIDLMRWLIRLVTPPDGTVLDPFLGSGTTGVAAHLENRDFIGIEREPEYMLIAEARIKHWSAQQVLF
jgi:site-specific DNA-methyltransferase (adenine-specific)